MASGVYNRGKRKIVENGWAGGTIRAMLVGTGYAFDPTHSSTGTGARRACSGRCCYTALDSPPTHSAS